MTAPNGVSVHHKEVLSVYFALLIIFYFYYIFMDSIYVAIIAGCFK